MKNSDDTIGNRTRDLPVCSAVPQPTAVACWEELFSHSDVVEDSGVLRLEAVAIGKHIPSYRKLLLPPSSR
jgi:hypothetical protein